MAETAPIIVTERFAVKPSEYTGRVTGIWLSHWGWLLIIPFGICGVLSFYRWEWIIVALALLLIIFPFILAMVYFIYGLSPSGIEAIRPRVVEINDTGILIHYFKRNEDDFVPCETSHYSWTEIKRAENNNKGITLRLKKDKYGHIFIPEAAMGENKNSFYVLLKENGTMFV